MGLLFCLPYHFDIVIKHFYFHHRLSDALSLRDALVKTPNPEENSLFRMKDASVRVFGSLGGEFMCDTASLWHPGAAEVS